MYGETALWEPRYSFGLETIPNKVFVLNKKLSVKLKEIQSFLLPCPQHGKRQDFKSSIIADMILLRRWELY